jgi:hypothetical protein
MKAPAFPLFSETDSQDVRTSYPQPPQISAFSGGAESGQMTLTDQSKFTTHSKANSPRTETGNAILPSRPIRSHLTGDSEREHPAESADCPPFSIRAHKRSVGVTSTPKRPPDVTVKYCCKVEIYSDGARLTAPSIGGKNEQSGKHKRGEIGGWSRSSRRRIR